MEDGLDFTVSFDHPVAERNGIAGAATGTSGSRRRTFRARRRERHGRGLRSPLLPAALPGAQTRAELFDQSVADSAERLHQLWGMPIEAIEFRVEEIPPGLEDLAAAGEHIPLGNVSPGEGGSTAIVIYRHPVLTAAKGHGDVAELIHDVVVEQAAVFLGTTPEAVDPMYGRFGA